MFLKPENVSLKFSFKYAFKHSRDIEMNTNFQNMEKISKHIKVTP